MIFMTHKVKQAIIRWTKLSIIISELNISAAHRCFNFFEMFAGTLFLLGIGTMRSVFSVFGAEQIQSESDNQIACYFAIFYAIDQLGFIFALIVQPKIEGSFLIHHSNE